MELKRHKASSICFVEEGLEGWIHFVGHCLPHVKLLEWEHVGCDKNVDGSGNNLIVQIWDLPDLLDLLALLDAVEEHLRIVAGGHGTSKQGVVVEQRHHVWFAI
jgi:hypothetical protein